MDHRPLGQLPFIALVLAALTACNGRSQTDAPWLTAVDPSAHAAYFPLLGTSHDPTAPGSAISCSSCHDGSTFRTFRCTGCHAQPATDVIHAGVVAGYAFESATCYQCHRDGTTGTINHARFFPIGSGTSHALACADCHSDPARRADLSTLDCASCHSGRSGFSGAHAGVKDFPSGATNADCLRCHADGQVDHVAAHQARFPIASGSITHDTACLQCHAQSRADKTYAADFGSFHCTGCHANPATDSVHQAVSGYAYASAACFECHGSGSAAPANHSTSFFPIGAGTKHDGVQCSECHTDLSNPTDPARFACDTCHLADASFSATHTSPASGVSILALRTASGSRPALSLTSPNCLLCHADSQVNAIASHPAGGSSLGRNDHQVAGCITCHSGRRGDKPFAARFDTRPGCVACHTNGNPG